MKFSCESSQMPRYQIDLAGLTVFCSPGVFVGTVTEGLSPACLPLMDFVKCMSSCFTGSSLRPLVVIQSCAFWNVISTTFVAVGPSCAEAAIGPSST